MRLFEITKLSKRDARLRRKAEAQPLLDLSGRPAQALDWYRGHGADQINARLRGRTPIFKPDSPEQMMADQGYIMDVDEAIPHLDTILANAPRRKRVIQVFRGEMSEARARELRDLPIHGSYVDPGFLSASLSPQHAFYAFASFGRPDDHERALSMILVPPTVPAAYVSDAQHIEMEFVIGRGTHYQKIEQRVIPHVNRGHPVRELTLMVWKAMRG